MVQFTENTWKLKKTQLFLLKKKVKLGERRHDTMWSCNLGIFPYILNILLLLGGLCLAAVGYKGLDLPMGFIYMKSWV